MERLFAYGTLLDAPVQERIIGRLVPIERNTLDGFVMDQVEIEGRVYPRIRKHDDGSISGGVLELTADELMRTDEYEGEEYIRVKVLLRDGVEAWVYVEP